VVLLLVGCVFAQRWVTPAETTNFRFTRFDGEYFPGTGKVYFLGGRLSAGTTDGTIWSYDPAARTYANTGVTMAIPVSNYDICLVRDMYNPPTDSYGLYVIGGRMGTGVSTDTIQVYYPKSNTVRKLTTDGYPGLIGGVIPSALGAVVAGNKIYVAGGFSTSTYAPSNLAHVFDPLASAGARWTQLSNLNFARAYIAGAEIDDTLVYAIGGDTTYPSTLVPKPYVERMNTRNTGAGWTQVSNLPMNCDETRAYAFQRADSLLGFSRKIVVAGTGQWPAESANCHLYHVTGDSWTAFPKLDSARRNHAGAYIPGTAGTNGVPGIWVWGGRKGSDAYLLKTPEYYALGLNVGVTKIDAPTGSVDSGAAVTPACSVYNYGAVSATYKVRMKIGSTYTDSATVTDHAPGARVAVTFTNWTANVPRGNYAVSCSTRCGNDFDQSNDKQTGTVTVDVLDVGTKVIVVPAGFVDSVATIVPSCSVYNYGTTTENYTVRMKIGAGYDQTAPVTAHASGSMQYVTFPDWAVGPRGTYAVVCSTQLTTDMNKTNDRMAGQTTVRIQDVSATSIVAPTGVVALNQVVTPQVKVKNLGSDPSTFDVQLAIAGGSVVYQDTETVTGLGAGVELTVTFSKTWTATPAGNYTAVAYTMLSGDINPANDTNRGNFSVSTGGGGWTEKSQMPSGAKPIKDGGWLAYDAGTARIYASRGNKQPDFFAYAPIGDSWGARSPWLLGTEAKPPSKGSAGCADGNGVIYATKGNNNSGFWKYTASTNAWSQLLDVPLGPSNKKVKGGTGLAFAYKGQVGSPYLLKGYMNEFYRYDIATNAWQTLPDAPIGGKQKWDKGSWLVSDGQHTLYALKAKLNEFYSYNTETDSWSGALTGMPMSGTGGAKKAKDGSCGAYTPAGSVFAFKGGNTQEFWNCTFTTDGNAWTEKETIPRAPIKKKVKAGAGMVAVGGLVFATKGNKTNELWVYVPSSFAPEPPVPQRDGVLAGKTVIAQGMSISPNPLASGFAVLRYGLPKAGAAQLSVYNMAGQTVMTRKLATGRSGNVNLDLRHLSNGVYLVKFSSEGFASSQKLVVER
jgi:hypothetical protein